MLKGGFNMSRCLSDAKESSGFLFYCYFLVEILEFLLFSACSYKATFSSDCCSTQQIHNEINGNDWFLDPWPDWLQACK